MFDRIKGGKQRKNSIRVTRSSLIYQKHVEQARQVILGEVHAWASRIGVTYNNVRVKNQSRRWGSCSSLGNLNFNFRILFLSPTLREYIIIHELCHLKELNHSRRFWTLVAQYYPAYDEAERELRLLEQTTRLEPLAIVAYVQNYQCTLCAPECQPKP